MEKLLYQGGLYGFRSEHETPLQAIEAAAVHFIAEIEDYSDFYVTLNTVKNVNNLSGNDDLIYFIQNLQGSLILVEDVIKLEKDKR